MLSPCEEWCMSHHWRMFRIFPQAILSPSKKAVKNLTTTDSAKCYSHSANRSIKFRSFQTEFMRDLTPQKGLITCLAYTPPWVSPSYFCQDDKIQTLWLYYNLFSDLKSGSDLKTWKLYFFVKTGQELMNCGVYELLRTSDVLSLLQLGVWV